MADEATRAAWLRVPAVFAHPDDEVWCAGGTLAQYAATGAEVMVVSATRGEVGQIRAARVATRRTLGQRRGYELQQACRKLGVQHAVCLDNGDGRLRGTDPAELTGHITRIVRTFRPDVVITFGPDGAYGHPNHIAIGEIATSAFFLAGDAASFPGQPREGLSPHRPARLYYSHFPRSRLLLSQRLGRWLVELDRHARGSVDFAHALLIFAEETTTLGISSDHLQVSWFPSGFSIVEQGEPATRLYLILSGRAEVIREDEDGTLLTLAQIGAGNFFGEEGLDRQQRCPAHVVAIENVTCPVFSPAAPTTYAERGDDAQLVDALAAGVNDERERVGLATTRLDVSAYVEQKVAAMAAHRTQFPLTPDMFPLPLLREMFGYEYFVQVYPPPELETSLFTMSDVLHSRWSCL